MAQLQISCGRQPPNASPHPSQMGVCDPLISTLQGHPPFYWVGTALVSCNINICNLSLKPIQWTPDCWWWNHVKSQLWIVKSYCFSLGPIFYPFHTTSLLPVVQALRERHLWMRRWNADGMPLPLSAVPAFSLRTGHPLGRPCISGRRPGTWVQLGGKEPYGQKNKIYQNFKCNLSTLQM